MKENHWQEIKQVLLHVPSVKVMDTVYYCPNWDASPMTHEDLKDYIICLKEVEMSVIQKLKVLNKVRRE